MNRYSLWYHLLYSADQGLYCILGIIIIIFIFKWFAFTWVLIWIKVNVCDDDPVKVALEAVQQ